MTNDKALKYLEVAEAIANFSKDRSTRVGAVIVGASNELRSVGYNGAPRGCSADEDDRGSTRPEKYYWFSHAELNAITNAAKVGIPLDGSSLVVTHPPCMDCSRAIVQAGIVHVFVPHWSNEFGVRWIEHISRSRRLFEECGVGFTVLSPLGGKV
jgi:dCMP deaminase